MPNLFSKLKIKNIELSNRIVMPPMALEQSTENGEVTRKMIDYYVERARGGVGLIIIEHSYVMPEGQYSKKQLGSYGQELLPGLAELAAAIMDCDIPVVLQISHAGPRGSQEVIGCQPWAPSTLKIFEEHETPREITLSEIDRVKQAFVKAAVLAREAGFSGVEIHGAHGFLLSSFSSPLANQRNDQYGGNLENRARLALEISTAVREAIGADYPLFFRLASDDMKPGGLEVAESKKIAFWLSEAGVDVIDVSGGLVGSRPTGVPAGYFLAQATEIKKEINIPVITVGGITDPVMANDIITSGKADLVAVGRAIMRDPLWPQKAASTLNQ